MKTIDILCPPARQIQILGKTIDVRPLSLKEAINLGRILGQLKTEIQAVRDIALVNSAKIDAHWEAASMWFSVIAILVTVVGIFVALAAVFREIVKAKTLTEQKVQDMINASISQAVSDAVEKALASFGK